MKITKSLVKPTAEQLAERPGPLNKDGLYADGPTPEQYVGAGYKLEDYPPNGYAPFGAELEAKPQVSQVQQQTESKPARKHYEAHNSNRAIRGETLDFHFSPYAHLGGTWMGTYSTENPKEIAELDKLVESKKVAVYSMTDLEYENALKKKGQSLQNLGPSLIHSEAAVSRTQASVKAADPLDTEPKAPEPLKTESADTLELADTKVPPAPGSEAHDAS